MLNIASTPLQSRSTLSSKAPKASKVLVSRYSQQVERIFWRKRDALSEVRKVRTFLRQSPPSSRRATKSSPNTRRKVKEAEVEDRIRQLSAVAPPDHINVQVFTLDGTIYTVPIQPKFIDSLDAKGGLKTGQCTILDIKLKLEETSGIRAGSQVMYSYQKMGNGTASEQDVCFEDDQTIKECGISDGQSICLVVDTDKYYWQQHAQLTQKYKARVIKVYKVMSLCAADVENTPVEVRRRFAKFLRNCRKALAVLLEHSSTHKVRPLEDLRRLERHFEDIVMPIFHAVMKREQHVVQLQRLQQLVNE